MLLTLNHLKKIFLEVIEKKKTFEEASAWAYERIQENEVGKLDLDSSEDRSKIFSGLTYLIGVDLLESPGVYFYSIQNVRDEFDNLFNKKID